jgi:hypothetical protein
MASLLTCPNGHRFDLTLVLETVGWTFFGGKDPFVLQDGSTVINSASGQTIVNIKPGSRLGIGEHFDVYGGYSLPLWGDKFYEQGMRFELRFAF